MIEHCDLKISLPLHYVAGVLSLPQYKQAPLISDVSVVNCENTRISESHKCLLKTSSARPSEKPSQNIVSCFKLAPNNPSLFGRHFSASVFLAGSKNWSPPEPSKRMVCTDDLVCVCVCVWVCVGEDLEVVVCDRSWPIVADQVQYFAPWGGDVGISERTGRPTHIHPGYLFIETRSRLSARSKETVAWNRRRLNTHSAGGEKTKKTTPLSAALDKRRKFSFDDCGLTPDRSLSQDEQKTRD
ncbi:hypothetical protein RRG08_034947 [Elysia crispata]|uniref:Uncharacterized protein n=1 Tax=Elysia crispata TaxID=231223 RepID=A0AAE0Y303_9GAST|nr:hypothetical protein RRG08_034947 [Elysia crispata]